MKSISTVARLVALTAAVAAPISIASCMPPEFIKIVELQINNCRALASASGFSGAYLSTSVAARATIPWKSYVYERYPDAWELERYSEPSTRNYFYQSEAKAPCAELPHGETLLMSEGKLCCDVIYEVEHPACRGEVVSKIGGKMGEIGEAAGVIQ